MAKDPETKKRKASVPERDAEEVKKVKNVVGDASGAPAKKRKATEDAAPVKAKKSKTPADSTTEGPTPAQGKKTKTPKSAVNGSSDSKPARKVISSDKPADEKGAKVAKASGKPLKEASNSARAGSKTDSSLSKKNKPIQKKVEAKAEGKQIEDKDDDSEVDEDEDSDEEVDDQTAALLKGFESDGDEEDDKIEEGYKDGLAIPTIEDNKELSKKKQAKLKRAAAFPGQGKPGVVYVGRIPHGFYENEMRAYFKQFGNILKLRLSRNKRTGASRHYAFIQFESATVADIVAKTMDNYLMFGHLLKVKFVPDEQVPADVFKGANKRFKKVPWNKMEGRKLEQGASETVWGERAGREQKRRDEKAEKLKAIGYEFDAPKIKSAKNVSKKEKEVLELTGDEDEIKAIEAAPVAEESSEHKKKKKKKAKAAKGAKGEVGVEELSKPEKQEEKSTDAKPSKEGVEESVATLIAETAEKSTKKEKKDKKKKKDVATSELKGNEDEVKPVEAAPTAESSSKPKKDKKKKKAKVVDE